MGGLDSLTSYARKQDPERELGKLLLSHNDTTITVFDLFPKGTIDHLLLGVMEPLLIHDL